MAKINGGNPGFVFSLNAVSLCGDAAGFDVTRPVENARTNCGNDQAAGPPETAYNLSGPLDFGAGLTEPTLWTHITGTAAQAVIVKASSATTGAANPSFTGSLLGDKYSVKLSATGNTMFDFSGVEAGTTGLPTRAIA